MQSRRRLLCALAGLALAFCLRGRADVLADSRAEFSGNQGQAHWYYGYRNVSAEGVYAYDNYDLHDYDATAAFIPFDSSAWTGTYWALHAQSSGPPWTTLGREISHPNGDNSGALHWTIRRWVAEALQEATLATLHWHIHKNNLDCGNGVTGALYLNGLLLDRETIGPSDAIGETKDLTLNLEPGDVVDLVQSPRGIDGANGDACDASTMWIQIESLQTSEPALSISLSNTTFNIGYSLLQTQGWVTLFHADAPEALLTGGRVVDYQRVPATGAGVFFVTNRNDARGFFRVLWEQNLTRGRALVFQDGPLDFDAMRRAYGDITNGTPLIWKEPAEVFIDNLGRYDTNGRYAGPTSELKGRFVNSVLSPIIVEGTMFTDIEDLYSQIHDFRVNLAGDQNVEQREALLWSSEAQLYHDINDYRNRFLNDAFIKELKLPPEIEQNLLLRQMRPDIDVRTPSGDHYSPNHFAVTTCGVFDPNGLDQAPWFNTLSVSARTRAKYAEFESMPPLSLAYDTGVTVGDYAGLVAMWIMGSNKGTGSDAFFGEGEAWRNNILPALNDGLSAWVAYVISGDPEVYKYT